MWMMHLHVNKKSNYDMMVMMSQNSADPDEMLPYAAFHLGLHFFQKYLFTSIQNEKGNVDSLLQQKPADLDLHCFRNRV